MANPFTITGTFNSKEVQSFGEMIMQETFKNPDLKELHTVNTGVKMKQQLGYVGLMGKTGISKTDCGNSGSGAKFDVTVKYTEPVGVGDYFEICPNDVDKKFKPYFDKISSFSERFGFEGFEMTDLGKVFTQRANESALDSIWRLAWHADTAAAASGVSSAGLKTADDVKFYDLFDGFFKQIFTNAGTGEFKKVEISKNAEVTFAAQEALGETYTKDLLRLMYKAADIRLRNHPDRRYYLSRFLYENYLEYLQDKSLTFTTEKLENGIELLRYNGIQLYNMETVWDRYHINDFEQTSAGLAYNLPHRAILTVPQNLAINTMNESDFDEFKMWYSNDDDLNKMKWMFTLDSMYHEDHLIVAAF